MIMLSSLLIDVQGYMSINTLSFVRAATEPFGHFIRPGHNDHRLLCQLSSEGRTAMSGVVFDPTFLKPKGELRSEINQRRLWTVLQSNVHFKVKDKLEKAHRKLEGWRQTLTELTRSEPAETFPVTPERRVQSIVVRH